MLLSFDESLAGEEFCVADPVFLFNTLVEATVNVAVEGCGQIAPSIQFPPPPLGSPVVEDTEPPVITINGSKLKKNNEVCLEHSSER